MNKPGTTEKSAEEILQEIRHRNERMYFSFQPRPDVPQEYDEQTSFYDSKHLGTTFILGGNGSGTTTVALAKAVKFLLREQEAPRPATPFWIISEGYNMVMDVCWNEKLYNRGLLPEEEVDWEKIDWYKPNQNWPFRVPLKPWPGGDPRNYWMLEFKSFTQGRSRMQAASIGGYLLVEQCPWDIVLEVNTRSRDYSFPGSKLAEFTPIDPYLSAPLEDMLNQGTLPKDWAVYRCNTECAMKAGHVSKDWYESQFESGVISDEMKETRKTGAFASYEGLIYPRFNPKIHTDVGLLDNLPFGCFHYRSIDWGSGPDNAFVCLWAAQDTIGNWIVYDEYYSTDQTYTYHDHAMHIQSRHDWPNDDWHLHTYGDPASPGLARLFGQSGIYVTSANNAVHEGIEAVRVALNLQNGDPKILIDRNQCPNLCRELQTYRWEKSKKAGLNPRDAKPQPLKKDDHACDALRYLLKSRSGKTQSGTGISGHSAAAPSRSRFVQGSR